MGIVDEDIDRVKAASPLDTVVGEHVQLRRVGSRYVGLCPFHAEKTPSFNVNAELGVYRCFGCSVGGDVITFVREMEHLDFVGAVEWLARRGGISLRYDNRAETGQRQRRHALIEVMEKAVDWYHQRLLTAPDAARARGYLRSRGLDGPTVKQYRIGWAPDDWDALCRSLGVGADLLAETGLGFTNKANRLQDSFRARVLFPIFDVRGDPVALGGRVLPGPEAREPKYKNSPATAVYDKSEVLYGLNWAKSEVVSRGEVVVCEGYTDVIGLASAGVPHAVATCGTALTERHLASLCTFARRIVLAFDADEPGQGAAARFYEWERKYGLDVAVAALPPGADPGDLARTDPKGLLAAVAGAIPFLAFRLERLLQGTTGRGVEARARVADEAAKIIAEHPNPIVRDQYVGEVAVRLDIRPEHLVRGQAAQRVHLTPPTPPTHRQSAAVLVLALLVQAPASVAPHLHEVLFADDLQRAAYRTLTAAGGRYAEAVAAADAETADLLQRLAVEDADVDADDVVALLVGEAAGRVLAEIEAEARQANDYRDVGWLKLRVEELWEAETRPSAVEQLVPFLVARAEEEG